MTACHAHRSPLVMPMLVAREVPPTNQLELQCEEWETHEAFSDLSSHEMFTGWFLKLMFLGDLENAHVHL